MKKNTNLNNNNHILIRDFYINFTVRQLIKAGSYLGNSFINIYSRQFVIGTRLKVAIINPLKTFTGIKKALSLLFNIVEYNDSALFINCFSNGYIFNKTNGLLDRKNFYNFLLNHNFFFKGAPYIKKSESRLRKILWGLYNLKEEKDNELIYVPQKYYPFINKMARRLTSRVIASWQNLKNNEAINFEHVRTNKIFEFINTGEAFLKNADNAFFKLDNLFENTNNANFIDQIFKKTSREKNYLSKPKINITMDNVVFYLKKLIQISELTKKNRRKNVRLKKKIDQLKFDSLIKSFFFGRGMQFNNPKNLNFINNNSLKVKLLVKLLILRRFFFNLRYTSKRLKLRWLDRAAEMIEKGQKHHYKSRGFVRKLKTFFNKNFRRQTTLNIFYNRRKNINLFFKTNKNYNKNKKLYNIKKFIFIKQGILKNKLAALGARKKMVKSYIKKKKKGVRSQLSMRRRFLQKGVQLKRALRVYTDRLQTVNSPLIFFVEGFWYYGLVSNGYVIPKTRYPTLAISLNLPAHNAYVWFANEFKSSRVPLITLLDSNLNGRFVDFFIPSNDDSFSILFFYKGLFENTLKFAFLKRLLFFIEFKTIY
jgi:hypothetical protein